MMAERDKMIAHYVPIAKVAADLHTNAWPLGFRRIGLAMHAVLCRTSA